MDSCLFFSAVVIKLKTVPICFKAVYNHIYRGLLRKVCNYYPKYIAGFPIVIEIQIRELIPNSLAIFCFNLGQKVSKIW